jgi:hypothetical protein
MGPASRAGVRSCAPEVVQEPRQLDPILTRGLLRVRKRPGSVWLTRFGRTAGPVVRGLEASIARGEHSVPVLSDDESTIAIAETLQQMVGRLGKYRLRPLQILALTLLERKRVLELPLPGLNFAADDFCLRNALPQGIDFGRFGEEMLAAFGEQFFGRGRAR